jgi:membrane-associated phospholipid phosphatase
VGAASRVREHAVRFDEHVDRHIEGLTVYGAVRRGAWLASRVGDVGVVALLTWWATTGDRQVRGRVLALAGHCVAVNFVVKRMFNRPRPLGGGHTSSFPSGHAATAAAVAVAAPAARRPLLVLAGVVAAGRLVGRSHFVSDVVVGATAGVTVGTLIRRTVSPSR